VISAEFQKLSLEPKDDCSYDSVTLYDGSSTSSPSLGTFCTDAPSTITSSDSAVLVVFKSDYNTNVGHFSLSWSFRSPNGKGWFIANL